MGAFGSQSPASAGPPPPFQGVPHQCRRQAGQPAGFWSNAVWEVVVFDFLFCFKKKDFTEKGNFLNENVIARRQEHGFNEGHVRGADSWAPAPAVGVASLGQAAEGRGLGSADGRQSSWVPAQCGCGTALLF